MSAPLKPNTSFPLRANAKEKEPLFQQQWNNQPKVSNPNSSKTFTLHDGPPFANGKVHMGHALNKVLKDVANRYYAQEGYKVHFVPGFDCHGLPTEMQVDKDRTLPPLELRSKCSEYASNAVSQQQDVLKCLGLMADWDNSYLTMSPEYEAAQLEAFAQLYFNGYLYRAEKEVYYSPSSHTVLAESELEYKDGSPLDWRTGEPVEKVLSKQWFFDLEQLRDRALEQAELVNWDSDRGKSRFLSMLKSRSYWCVSRQRTWGLPLPFFYDENDSPLLTLETLNFLMEKVRDRGSNVWWELPVEELLPPQYLNDGHTYRKGTDTMDVWLDSGLSWYAVLKQRNMSFPADVYLEGSDQHRGWFQSSFLTSVALTGMPPFKSVVTHGFVLDKNSEKMSKSKGNALNPTDVLNKYSADVLRLWVVSSDFRNDVAVSDENLEQAFEFYKKLRSTFRFALANLFDYQPTTDVELLDEDKQALDLVNSTLVTVKHHYEKFEFNKAMSAVKNLLSTLSADWFGEETTKLKGRLYQAYEGQYDSPERRSGQHALNLFVLALLEMTSPVTPHLGYEVNLHHN